MPDSTINNLLAGAFRSLANGRGIVAAYLYGSHARGQARPDSDVDVAVLLENDPKNEPLELLKLGRELEKATGLTNVDLRLLNDAPLSASGRILTEGLLVFSGDDSARVGFEVRIRGLYFDFLPHLKYLRQALINRTAESGL